MLIKELENLYKGNLKKEKIKIEIKKIKKNSSSIEN